MKRIYGLIFLILGIAACKNQPVTFPDYKNNAVYFPFQLPVRTLSLGEDRIDNSLDKEFKFDVGVCIGGMYQNNRDWTVDYVVDTTLTRKVYVLTSPQLYTNLQKIKALPESYYSLTPQGTAIIPSGDFNGSIRVQLTDAFFDDTMSVTGTYVIPLRMTGTSADSILSGQAAVASPDPRIVANWVSNRSPKNWVMFGINYVNAYHGNYLHRGRDIRTTKATGLVKDTIIFRNPYGYVERDILIKLTTVGRKKVITNGLGNSTGGNYSMIMEFANDKGTPGAVTISSRPGTFYPVTGSGQYFDIATSTEEWSLLRWQSMYLSYSFDDGTLTHQVNDTLVFRDRGIKFTQNSIVIQP